MGNKLLSMHSNFWFRQGWFDT